MAERGAAEPIDLLGAAGGGVIKRIGPVAAGVVLAVGGPAAVGARRTRPTRDLTLTDTGDKVNQ